MQHGKLKFLKINLMACLLLPSLSYASFIETTIGTAVVNDATAAYYNPAALTLLQNAQIIPLLTVSRFQTKFNGQSTVVPTNFTQRGAASSVSYYYSPSFYFAMPVTNRMTFGLAAISNFANRNFEDNSILRYVQSSNTIQDYDLVPALGFKINNYVSVGAGVNLSYTKMHLEPNVGFPGSNVADSQSSNQSEGSGVGANAGFLLKPKEGTLLGFNYRTITTYRENGTSRLSGAAELTSNNYRFQLRTPARSVFTISQLLTPTVGLITTIQRMQWGMIRNIKIYDLATLVGNAPVIINATVPYYLRDTWILTFGGHYRFQPNWIARIAATYNQSPSNGHYQISTGDSYILGASLGYQINKTITLDCSYAHAFIKDESIQIAGNRYVINGNNQASRDAVSLKLTWNV
jgi:long-subunit fatty acid transport protein